MEWINETSEGTTLRVRAVPRASKNEIQGLYDDALKIRLTTPPVDGKANEALCRFLSKTLKISKSQIKLTQGETDRRKTFQIQGLTPEQIKERVGL